jgi:predicted nucleotidyltransferase
VSQAPSPVAAEPAIAPALSAAPAGTTSPDPLGLLVAARLAESIRPLYGAALRGVYLYGARASGPTAADTDVETIIVLDRIERYGEELDRTSHACASLSHELKLVVSRVFVSEAIWNGDPDGVPPRVRRKAVAV